jgi:hypothetical protein
MTLREAQEVLEEFHRRHGQSVTMWEYKAVMLRYSVEVLFRQVFADSAKDLRHRRRKSLRPSVHESALMLAGMMIETLAKAVLISRQQSGRIKAFTRHDLPKVVRAAGVELTAEENVFLGTLSEFVKWAGRYPVSWTTNAMAVDDEHGHRNMVGGSQPHQDLQRVRALADKLECLLPGTRVRTGMRLPSGAASAKRSSKA